MAQPPKLPQPVQVQVWGHKVYDKKRCWQRLLLVVSFGRHNWTFGAAVKSLGVALTRHLSLTSRWTTSARPVTVTYNGLVACSWFTVTDDFTKMVACSILTSSWCHAWTAATRWVQNCMCDTSCGMRMDYRAIIRHWHNHVRSPLRKVSCIQDLPHF